jgi:hypothetical protein
MFTDIKRLERDYLPEAMGSFQKMMASSKERMERIKPDNSKVKPRE